MLQADFQIFWMPVVYSGMSALLISLLREILQKIIIIILSLHNNIRVYLRLLIFVRVLKLVIALLRAVQLVYLVQESSSFLSSKSM